MNEKFQEKLHEIKVKYDARIKSIATANGVDEGVGLDMFISNAERGTAYPGGGECTAEEWAEIIKDVADLRQLGRG